jgi:hypothetical protein
MSLGQAEGALHVRPAEVDDAELVVAVGDVSGARWQIGAAQQVLAVQFGLGCDIGLVDEQSGGV